VEYELKAIVLDIDGTITDETRRVCVNAVNTIYRAENKIVPIIFVTGNVMCAAKTIAILLGTTGGLVAENGGVIESHGKKKILGNITECKKAYESLKSKLEVKKVELSYQRVSELAIERTLPEKLVKETVKDFNVIVYDTKFAIHLTDPLVDKGSSLKMITTDLGIKMDEILAIGDSENDIEFLRVAGVKVAVNNADNEIKDIADYITEKSYGDGVAEAIERFIL
jgi:phosphoglycolate phosphatase (TIGR01487 family)